MACGASSSEKLFQKVFAELCASSLCIACLWLWRSFIRMNGNMSTKGEFNRTRCHILAFLWALCRLPIRSQGAAGVTALGSSLWKAQGLQQLPVTVLGGSGSFRQNLSKKPCCTVTKCIEDPLDFLTPQREDPGGGWIQS